MGIGSIGIWEILVLAVIVLIFFGPDQLPEIGRSIGQTLREFKRSMNEVKREFEEVERSASLRGSSEDRRSRPSGRVHPPGREEPEAVPAEDPEGGGPAGEPGSTSGDEAGGDAGPEAAAEEPSTTSASEDAPGDGSAAPRREDGIPTFGGGSERSGTPDEPSDES